MNPTQASHEPQQAQVVSPAEFFGKLIYNHISANGGYVADVATLPNQLRLTPEQLADGLRWCADHELLELYIY
jgi:hypothetical protein